MTAMCVRLLPESGSESHLDQISFAFDAFSLNFGTFL